MALPLDSLDLTSDQVRERFEWARRQGNPAWLWPELTAGEWREASDRIADAASAVLAGEKAPVLDVEPRALEITAYTSGTGPLLLPCRLRHHTPRYHLLRHQLPLQIDWPFCGMTVVPFFLRFLI